MVESNFSREEGKKPVKPKFGPQQHGDTTIQPQSM
jgi:hypothetical protein